MSSRHEARLHNEAVMNALDRRLPAAVRAGIIGPPLLLFLGIAVSGHIRYPDSIYLHDLNITAPSPPTVRVQKTSLLGSVLVRDGDQFCPVPHAPEQVITSNEPVLSVVSPDEVLATGPISRYDAGRLKVGQTVHLTIRSDTELTEGWTDGYVQHIFKAPADTKMGTYSLSITLPAALHTLDGSERPVKVGSRAEGAVTSEDKSLFRRVLDLVNQSLGDSRSVSKTISTRGP